MMFLVLKDSIELGLFLSLVSSGPSQYLPSRSNSRGLNESGSQAQINPSVIIIIVVLSVVFFLSGCLHLLVRCLVRNPRRDPNNIVSLTAVQGQLQQLFLLHDSGVEQAFIDTLPVFFYKSVSGLKEGADCAVCLNEFQGEDRLRLLPKCSHAFHLECIDTWLLSHSTCPLCRSSLLSDGLNLPPAGPALLLDSNGSIADGVDHVEAVQNDDEVGARRLHGQYGVVCSSLQERHLDGSCATAAPFDTPLGHAIVQRVKGDMSTECNKLERQEEPASVETGGRVVPVLLGRFRILEDSGYGASSSASRRSYSVGSYEYVMDPSNLEVVIAPTPCRRRTSTPRRVTPGHRTTLSECTPEDVTPDPVATPFGDSLFERRLSPVGEGNSSYVAVDIDSIAANLASTRESATKEEDTRESATKEEVKSTSKSIKLNAEGASKMSISKQELQSNNCIPPVERLPSRRAFSFRLPLVDAKLKISASRRSLSESDVAGWDEEDPSVSYAYPTGFAARAPTGVQADVGTSMPSIARRTINWLVGRQKRIVHASSGAPR